MPFQTFPSLSDRRTARADNPGTALSFISHTELDALAEVEEALGGGESVLNVFVSKSNPAADMFAEAFFMFYLVITGACLRALCSDKAEAALKPYEFKMEEIEGFRYRCRVSPRRFLLGCRTICVVL